MTMTPTAVTDMLDAIRTVCRPGLRPEVDAAVARAEATARDASDRVHDLYRALSAVSAPTPHAVAGRLLAGELTAAEAVTALAAPALDRAGEDALRLAVETSAARATREAVELACDSLNPDYATVAVAPLWQAWTAAAHRLAVLLDDHAVEATAAAVLGADPAVTKAWRAATTAARATLNVCAAVAEIEGDLDGGPTSLVAVYRWWVPTAPTALGRRDQLRSWDPGAGPVELLPVAAGAAGVTLTPRTWVEAEITRMAHERIETRPGTVVDMRPGQELVDVDDGLDHGHVLVAAG